jgi:hypothetical protein
MHKQGESYQNFQQMNTYEAQIFAAFQIQHQSTRYSKNETEGGNGSNHQNPRHAVKIEKGKNERDLSWEDEEIEGGMEGDMYLCLLAAIGDRRLHALAQSRQRPPPSRPEPHVPRLRSAGGHCDPPHLSHTSRSRPVTGGGN